ncbi:MAG: tetratricopeptide repeat protein [Candidatus Krumholzibacteriota bacterium]|nr:tetratricopeptide repeat protein [Candidatus Krumholzibacteriota bacterium]
MRLQRTVEYGQRKKSIRKEVTRVDRRSRQILLLILAVGAVFRVVYLIQLSRADIGEILPLDMTFYKELAGRIASGGGMDGQVISFNPLYPFFLGAVFRVFGDGLIWIRMIQSVAGLATIFLLFVSGRFLGRKGDGDISDGAATGLTAAATGLLYPQFLLYEGSLLATTFITFITTASFTLSLFIDAALKERSRIMIFSRAMPTGIAAFTLGILLGGGALGRPNLFFLLILLIPLWLIVRGGKRIDGVRLAVFCAAGVAIMLLPPVIYNAAHTGRFVPVTTHGGINFYIGNRPGATGIYAAPEGMRSDMRGLIEDAETFAEKESGRDMSPAEVSDYWFGRSREWVFEEPGAFLRLLSRKFVLFWNGTEVSDIIEISIFRRECGALWFLFVPFSAISILAFSGFCVLLYFRRNRGVPLIFLSAALGSIMLFYINSRYRIPSVPVLIVAAALSVTTLAEWVRRGKWVHASVLMAVSIAVLFSMAGRNIVAVDKSAAYTFAGNHFMKTGEFAKGEEAFAQAYRMAPGKVMTNINYGRALLKGGDTARARDLYSSAFEIDPDFPLLAVEYGSLLEQIGNRDEAAKVYLYAYGLDRTRDRILACQFLSRIEYESGRLDKAIDWIRKGLDLIPGDEKLTGILNSLEMEENSRFPDGTNGP